MAREVIELDSVDLITIDAIGQPGQRVFYLQAAKDGRFTTVILEKVQVLSVSAGIDRLLSEIIEQFPDLDKTLDTYNEELMRIQPPVDPLFRAGEIGLAYDTSRDQVCIIVKEILTGEMQEENASEVRIWATRQQMTSLSRWGVEVSGRGRPICPQCGEAMDPAGHFCPKKNGHKH